MATAILLLAASSAPAAKQWSETRVISDPGEDIELPHVALSSRGRAVAVWYREKPEGGIVAMRGSILEPGSGFGPAQTLGPADPTSGRQPPSPPDVAIDRKGNAIATWSKKDADGNLRVVAAFLPVGGEFGELEFLSPPGASAYNPRVAFDRHGGATAVWVRFDDGAPRAQAADRAAKDTEFGKPEWLSKEKVFAVEPRIEISDSGRAVAVWGARTEDSANLVVQAAGRSQRGEFGDPQTLSDPARTADGLDLAIGAKGDAVATWRQESPGFEVDGEIATAFAPPGDPFRAPVRIAHEAGHEGFAPQVEMDKRGVPTLLWHEGPQGNLPGTSLIQSSEADQGGNFVQRQTLELSDAASQLYPALAVGPGGDAIAAWLLSQREPLPRPIEAAVRGAASEEFGPVQRLSPPAAVTSHPAVAMNRKLGIVIWEQLKGDGAGPWQAAGSLYRKR